MINLEVAVIGDEKRLGIDVAYCPDRKSVV